MYDTYARLIYEWLVNNKIASKLTLNITTTSLLSIINTSNVSFIL